MIFIQGNFPSFKNSKQRTRQGFMIMSKTVQKYLKAYEYQFTFEGSENKSLFLNSIKGIKQPYMIGMHFVRGTKHRYDWINMCQGVQDLMVKHNWIEDDNTNIMFPIPLKIDGEFSSYDKDNPGVYITILQT